jgi:hypothetical protein
MGNPPFDAEKQQLVRDPAKAARDTGKFLVVPPTETGKSDDGASSARDPSVTPPYSKLQVHSHYEIEQDMMELARQSPTFRAGEAALKSYGVQINWHVAPLAKEKGGGESVPLGKTYDTTLDPETVPPGFHIFDVFLHEYGEMLGQWRGGKFHPEEDKSKTYLKFMNSVQEELKLRKTPDSHVR